MSINNNNSPKVDKKNLNIGLRNRKNNKNPLNILNILNPDILKEIYSDDNFNYISESDGEDNYNSQDSETDYEQNFYEYTETDSVPLSSDNINSMIKHAEEGKTNENEESRLAIREEDVNEEFLAKRNLSIKGNSDNNAYHSKKTIAQGMMDIALLSANANQLRYVLESYQNHPYFYPSIILIAISIVFQFAVGIGLILNYRCNYNDETGRKRAKKMNDLITIGIYIITTVNCFISAFCVSGGDISFKISDGQAMKPDTIS